MSYHDYVKVDGYPCLAVVLRLTSDDHAEVRFERGLTTFVPVSSIHPR